MEKSQRRSMTKRKISMIKTGNRQSIIITQREAYENGLNKIFSQPPSHLGYKSDIEALLNELGLKMDELLYLAISSLSKISRNKNEIKIIASYLYLMPDIIKLLKGKDMKKKEQLILKDLISLSESMTYEKYQKNFILTKFGDIGSTAYVILDGQVDVLIKSFKNMNISKYDYLFYLANLLKYSEYGLLNEVINENFSKFPLEIYDNFNRTSISSIKFNDSLLKKNDTNIQNQKKEKLSDEKAKNNNINKDNSNKVFILNDENKEIKEFKKVYKITINNLMEMFNLKMTEKKNLIFCTLNDYINRIELIPDDYKNYIKKIYLKKRNSFFDIKDKEKKDDDEEDENGQYNLKIFSYSKVATLGKGTLFGEIALQDANSLRTGTIITSSDCHCSVLNKKTFDLCLKKGAEKYLKELLNFFIELPIFNGIPENVFYHKYYTFLSKKNMIRGKNIITQGEKPENIVILQTGSYGLTTRISLFDLTKLIYHFIKLNLNNRNSNDLFDEEIKKYKRLLRKTQKIINEATSIMNQNLKFKKFYVNEVYIRITDITCPDIVGYKEYVDENGFYAFTIETKSPENIIYILENKFYNELQSKNVIVKKNQKELLEKKINVMIQRLLIIRNSLVNSFFDSKSEKEISSLIIKELEDLSISKLKQKRFLKFKSTEFKFNKNNKDSKDNDNFKINISPEKEGTKFKKIKKMSRNYKINKNIDFDNSESKTELKQNFLAKSISSSYTKNNFLKRPNTNNKISKKVINLYKSSSRNFNSAKKINENNNFINKKNFFLDMDYSKEKSQLSSQNLKELNINFKLKQKMLPKSSYKKVDEVQCAKSSYTPKLNSAHDSCKKFHTSGIFLNNLVWEEIKSKIRNQLNYNYNHVNYSSTHRNKNLNFFEQSSSFKTNNVDEIKPPFTSDRFYNAKIMTKNIDNNFNIKLINKTPKLYKSSSELSLQKKIRLKSSNHFNSAKLLKINNNISEEITDIAFDNNMMNNYNHFLYPEKIAVPKINLRIKKMFSPQEVNFMRQLNRKNKVLNILKYYEKKCEKYRLDRNIYYNNNLKNRMKLFYGTERTKIKI